MRKLSDYLIPLPKKIEEGEGRIAVAGFGGSVNIKLASKDALVSEAKVIIEKRLADIASVTREGKKGGFTVKMKVDALDPAFADVDMWEAYYIKTSKKEALLVGKDPAGVLYAAYTFTEMLALSGDTVTLPEAYILDYPDFKYRGHTIESRYGTEFMTREEYYNMIDYFSAQKLNRLVVTLYDCWNFQYDNDPAEFLYMKIPGHPEIKSPKRIKYYSVREGRWIYKKDLLPSLYEYDFFGDVVAYAKRKNIVIVPQINTLGHNTLIPRMIPEISAKNEDGTPKNIGYCTNDPKTYELIFAWIDEIIDKYVLPYGNDEIHFGLDEVYENFKCKCPKCCDLSREEIFLDYAIRLIQHAKGRGMKHVYICHDMFLALDAVTDANKQRFVDAKVDDVTVLDWWTYEDPTAGLFYGKADKVRPILRSRIKPYSGYQNWMAIQDTHENIRGCVKLAIEHGFEGLDAYSTFDPAFDKNFLTIADVSWNNGEVDNVDYFDRRYAEKYYSNNRERALTAFHALREMMTDDVHVYWQNRINRWLDYYMYGYRLKNYDEDGNLYLTLKNYPGDAFDRLLRSDRVDIAYLEMVMKNSREAISFFENSGRHDLFNDTWLLTARYYNRTADEFLSIVGAYKEYEDGLTSPARVIELLERLISERERLMSFAESVKINHNAPTFLRDMSVVRQFLIDLRDYFVRESEAGRRPRFDITNLDYAMSEKFGFLR